MAKHGADLLNPTTAIVRDVRDVARTTRGDALVGQISVRHRRCLNREDAAYYAGVSPDTIDRLIGSGALRVVKYPVERAPNGHGRRNGALFRVLIDVRDLDLLIERSKQTV